jgi:hypothetical protein
MQAAALRLWLAPGPASFETRFALLRMRGKSACDAAP